MGRYDGAEFYARPSIATVFYDTLFTAPSIAGDLEFYKAFCARNGTRFIDAACGTGRIAKALAAPFRRIVAFDNSPYFIGRMRQEVVSNPPPGRIQVRRSRLETFGFNGLFDGIIVSYYAFNHVLDAGDRETCFRNLLDHLRPGGRIVIQLPRIDLLTRTVPRHEIDALCVERRIEVPALSGDDTRPLTVRQDVEWMHFDTASGIRSIGYRFGLVQDGKVLHEEQVTKRLAAVSPAAVDAIARRHDARIVDRLDGFHDGVQSEAIFEIEKR